MNAKKFKFKYRLNILMVDQGEIGTQQENKHEKNLQAFGVIAALVGSVCFACATTLAKEILKNDGLPLLIFIFYRLFFMLLYSIPIVRVQNLNILSGREKKLTICLQAFSGMMAISLFFLAVKYLPVAEAGVLFNATAPIFSSILSTFLLKAKFKYFDIFLFLLSTTGVVLILHPPFLFAKVVLPEHDIPFNDRLIGSFSGVAGGFFAVRFIVFIVSTGNTI